MAYRAPSRSHEEGFRQIGDGGITNRGHKMTILIISDQFDTHADVVQEKLISDGRYVFRLNLDVDSLKTTTVSYVDGGWEISSGGATLRGNEVRCVWCRRTSVSLTAEQQVDLSNGFRLWRSEWNRVLFGFYNSIQNAEWMNNIRQATLADNKYFQMIVARSCGLNMPETITSNDRSVLTNFAQEQGFVALKFMSQDMYHLDDNSIAGLYVNKVDVEAFSDFSDSGENPVTLQRYVDKDFEVRYTYVDGEAFVCKIESQKSPKTMTDWRRYDVKNTPHTAICPPESVATAVVLLMSKLDLRFGAIDFMVDKSGVWWFLEVNTAGQWLWIEDLSGLKISDSIALALAKHAA